MPRLAFLTLDDRTGFVIDDALAIAELARRGVVVDEVPWRREAVTWCNYDGVVVRTPWDYQRDLDRFLARLEGIEALGVPLANDAALVRWNARKTYLRDLAACGAPTVPSLWGNGLAVDELRALPARLGGGEAVIKPIVGANADDTYRLPAPPDAAAATTGAVLLEDGELAARIAARFVDREWLAQPFVRSVLDEGERSLFYFDGALSHAVVKRPKPGDFRVQEEHGGLIERLEPDAAMRSVGEVVLRALAEVRGPLERTGRGEMPLQARVDLVRLDDGSLALMELEAIEPSLYFRMHAEAPRRFAVAVERWLARKSQ